MGGFGSGQRRSRKPVVEGCYSFDVGTFQGLKALKTGQGGFNGFVQWKRADGTEAFAIKYDLAIDGTAGTLMVEYAPAGTDREISYPIRMSTTACHRGGSRWWFRCPLWKEGQPKCGRRIRKLYLRGMYFGCRQCHRLTYTSTRESDARVYRLLRRGLDAIPDTKWMSISQLGLWLKAIEVQKRRWARFDKRWEKMRSASPA